MNYQNLIFSRNNGIGIISLNRPKSFNALTVDLLTELNNAIKLAETDEEVKVLVLKGEGKGFCSGQDLSVVESLKTEMVAEVVEKYYNPVIKNLRIVKKPVICQLHGIAAGAGMSLALACDLIIAEESAAFVPGFLNIGLVPDSGATSFLIKRLGRWKAFEILSSGKPVFAIEAMKLGIVSVVVKMEELEEQVTEVAAGFVAGPSFAISLLKEMLNKAETADLAEVLSLEAKMQEKAASTEDFKEGVSAFIEKRKAAFKGK